MMCVLYVIVKKAEEGFKEMLNVLRTWCERWSLVVNVKKTQIVHFRPMCITLSC